MNSLTRVSLPGPDVPIVETLPPRSFSWLPDLMLFLRRRWRVIAATAAVVLALAVVYTVFATPKYTATAALLIDTQAAATLQNQPTINDAQYINGLVESQLEVVQSEGVARAVVDKLGLAKDQAFLENGKGKLSAVKGFFLGLFSSGGPALSAGQKETLATQLLQKMISVERLGESYVLNISVTSLDPEMSAKLANAVAKAYAQAGLNARSAATRSASAWMDQRLGELRSQSVAADAKVVAFKAAHHIVDTDKGLMNQRELSVLSKQLVLARTNAATAQARYDQIRSIMKNGIYDGSVMDALNDEVITKLREEYLKDQREHAIWASQYGAKNGSVRNLALEMTNIQSAIQSELARIASSYQSAYQSAVTAEQQVQQRLDQLTNAANGINRELVTLRSLESQAQTYRTLYGNFLQRYTLAEQDESFPVSQSEVVTTAVPPVKPSWPKTPLILAAACVLGSGLGFMLAIGRDSMDRGMRTGAQIRTTLGLDCLGMVPMIRSPKETQYRRRDMARHVATRSLANWPALLRVAGTEPMSQCAEVMRRTRLRIAQLGIESNGAKVIGCVSARPGEGKSTVSANLAACMARAGERTLLIDWDLRKLSLTRALSAGRPMGFIDLVAGSEKSLSNVLWYDPITRLRFLPGGSGSDATLPCPIDAFDGKMARELIEALRQHYDCIIVDLPAMDAASDADAAASMVDALLLVVEWGRTDTEVIMECLAGTRSITPRLMGAVLNKVDMRTLRHYADYSYGPAAYGRAPAAA